VDKRENYIKRCVAIPGDVVEIKQSILYINGAKAFVAENQNLQYKAYNFVPRSKETMQEKYNLEEERQDYYRRENEDFYTVNATKSELNRLKQDFPEARFEVNLTPQYSDTFKGTPSPLQMMENLGMFPKDIYINNTTTDFNEFKVPAKGSTVQLTKNNIAWYRRIITAYEGHTLVERGNDILIDGKKVTSYTFALNYYWMMGDNRYNSADSRVWGFVPEDHIVGRASLVWFSKSPYMGVRWERLFKMIH
jgi:signal peptidase I